MHQNGQPSGEKVGDFIAARLRAWGVTRVYGYAGDGINGIIGGIQRAMPGQKVKPKKGRIPPPTTSEPDTAPLQAPPPSVATSVGQAASR